MGTAFIWCFNDDLLIGHTWGCRLFLLPNGTIILAYATVCMVLKVCTSMNVEAIIFVLHEIVERKHLVPLHYCEWGGGGGGRDAGRTRPEGGVGKGEVVEWRRKRRMERDGLESRWQRSREEGRGEDEGEEGGHEALKMGFEGARVGGEGNEKTGAEMDLKKRRTKDNKFNERHD